MDAQKGNIYEILNGSRQFTIPIYQRMYSWDLEQCERLWNDIVEMQQENKSGHFIGSIVNIAEKTMPTGIQTYTIIDGQQRMTTLTLLLIALRNYSYTHPENSNIKGEKIHNTLLKNIYESDFDQFKLLLTETDRDILISLIDQKPIPKDSNSKLVKNYQFFENQINKDMLPPEKIFESIGKLQIVNITLKQDEDDPQAIFESLNSTGKKLSHSDLIRNFILMGLTQDEQKEIYSTLWRPFEKLFYLESADRDMDLFFRNYLTIKNEKIPKKEKIYEEFKSFYRNHNHLTAKEVCQELYLAGECFTNIIYKRSSDDELKKYFEEIQTIKMEVSYPLLPQVLMDYEQNLINLNDVKEIFRIAISYVIRRIIVGTPTNVLNSTFVESVKNIQKEDYVNSVKAYFILLTNQKKFPTNEEILIKLETKDVYNLRTKNYILSKLENYDNKEQVIIENLTIEHIMPQNKKMSQSWRKELGENWEEIQTVYLHTLGNLTLTAYNSELSDSSFIKKRDMAGGFRDSGLRLNKGIRDLEHWNEDTIINRSRYLARQSLEIWPYPAISEEEITPYIQQAQKHEYNLDTYSFGPLSKMLFDALDKRIMNLNTDIYRVFTKTYIAYKLDTNITDIVVNQERINIMLNMKFNQLYDPKNLASDVSTIGKWGNGEVRITFTEINQLDDIMDLITQSYHLQIEQ